MGGSGGGGVAVVVTRRSLVLMGSGETSPTMVKTHRSLLDGLPGAGAGVLLDTPFGFQSNADELTAKAQQYFAESVGHPIGVASFRTVDEVGSASYESAMAAVRAAAFVFAGPGSPTYALRVWRASVLPSLLEEKVSGSSTGVVTFASAAALTIGVVTVPVYEIYKVGAEPVWAEGLDLLSAATGGVLSAAVIPHYDNAEGGTHDTRYCYLGESRLALLESSLPAGAFVLGVDEHTGLVLDLTAGSASVVGRGGVTVRSDGASRVVAAGSVCGIEELRPSAGGTAASAAPLVAEAAEVPVVAESPLLEVVREHEARFDSALAGRDATGAVQAVLDLEAALFEWSTETSSGDEYARSRGALRGMVVRLGEAAVVGVRDARDVVGPFVEALLSMRASARAAGRWADADIVRDALVAAGVEVRDTASGVEWDLRG